MFHVKHLERKQRRTGKRGGAGTFRGPLHDRRRVAGVRGQGRPHDRGMGMRVVEAVVREGNGSWRGAVAEAGSGEAGSGLHCRYANAPLRGKRRGARIGRPCARRAPGMR
ncbi:hypothetical protein CE91St32_02300 [Gordonibacter pamelaeae]|nr:hypothetical protein CE91St32_02300 [Gordonibacter pamelaeae]